MSVLKELRALMPRRALSHSEARWVAERQASRLRELTGCTDEPFLPREVIASQPKVDLVFDNRLPQSGSSHWTGRMWQITINATEPFTRQRYTAAHEYKHCVDFPFDEYCYPAEYGQTSHQRAELICDYFAACLLMPKVMVRRAWTAGGDNQNPAELARIFGVSTVAMEIRLQELGLLQARYRCRFDRLPLQGARTYHRSRIETRELLPLGGGVGGL
jgi:Zn-dependent peptidase ImmA (M78 family)